MRAQVQPKITRSCRSNGPISRCRPATTPGRSSTVGKDYGSKNWSARKTGRNSR